MHFNVLPRHQVFFPGAIYELYPLCILRIPSLTSLCALTSHRMSTFSSKETINFQAACHDVEYVGHILSCRFFYCLTFLYFAMSSPFQLLSAWYQEISRTLFKPKDFLIIMSF